MKETETGDLSPTSRALVSACKANIGDRNRFIDSVKVLRGHLSTITAGKGSRPPRIGKEIFSLQGIVRGFNEIIKGVEILKAKSLEPCSEVIGEEDPMSAVAQLVGIIRRISNKDLSEEDFMIVRRSQDILEQRLHEIMLSIVEVGEGEILDICQSIRSNQTRRVKERQRRAKERERTMESPRTPESVKLVPLTPADMGPNPWISRLMHQLSSAGERVAPI